MLDFKSARDLDREIVMAVVYGGWCQLLLFFFYSVILLEVFQFSGIFYIKVSKRVFRRTGHFEDIWTFGHFVVISWTFRGHFVDISRTFGISWTFRGHLVDNWSFRGHLVDIWWTFGGQLDISRTFGGQLDISR